MEGMPIVEVVTLTALFAEYDLNCIDLLKLDCEGAEYDILLGAPAEILARVANVLCEFHEVPARHVSDIVGRLDSNGFHVQVASGARGMLVARRPSNKHEVIRAADAAGASLAQSALTPGR